MGVTADKSYQKARACGDENARGCLSLMVDPVLMSVCRSDAENSTQLVQLLHRKKFALTIIDHDVRCEEADLVGDMIV